MTSPVLRFAPSPTGLIHVGNARVALLNWLYARKNNGRFILRFDDTDPDRSKPEYVDAIREDLEWLGMDWDAEEKQSERLERYNAVIARLKSTHRLYDCYESEAELNWKRKAARQRHRPFIYDRKALGLSDADKAALTAEGRKAYWRFRLADGVTEWDDLAKGPTRFETRNLSDPVLIRDDGSLLYLLASATDDFDMGVTHILRGEDHVSNTPAQIQLYTALGGKAEGVRFGHLPLLAGAEGGKLSKRVGSLSIRELRNDGFEVQALLGMLGHLGTNKKIEPLTIKDLIIGFDVADYGRATPKFDPAELAQLNEKAVHAMGWVRAEDKLKALGLTEATEAFWTAVRPNLWRIDEARLWWQVITTAQTPLIEEPGFIAEAARLLPEGEITETTWADWTGAVKTATGRKGRQLFMPLRKALTGKDHGPELAALLPLMGRARIEARLRGDVA